MEQGSVVAAITGMALVVLGVFQFLKSYIASSNKDYLDLRTKWEVSQTKILELETNNLLWKNKALIATQHNKALRRKLAMCHETIQSALLKTHPIPDMSQIEDETVVPE